MVSIIIFSSSPRLCLPFAPRICVDQVNLHFIIVSSLGMVSLLFGGVLIYLFLFICLSVGTYLPLDEERQL